MPFLLRRTKDEVLSDLPEKIIQDRYCDLSPVQLKLYEQFSGSHVKQEITSMVKVDGSMDSGDGNGTSAKASTHVFQVTYILNKKVFQMNFFFVCMSSITWFVIAAIHGIADLCSNPWISGSAIPAKIV